MERLYAASDSKRRAVRGNEKRGRAFGAEKKVPPARVRTSPRLEIKRSARHPKEHYILIIIGRNLALPGCPGRSSQIAEDVTDGQGERSEAVIVKPL